MIIVRSRQDEREHWIDGLSTLPKNMLLRVLRKLGSEDTLDDLPDPLRFVNLTTHYIVTLLERETGHILTRLRYAGHETPGYNYTLRRPIWDPEFGLYIPPEHESEDMELVAKMKRMAVESERLRAEKEPVLIVRMGFQQEDLCPRIESLCPAAESEPVPAAAESEPVPAAAESEPVPAAAESGEPVPAAAESGEPVPTAAESGEPVPTAAESGEPVPTAAESGEPVPADAAAESKGTFKDL